MPERRHSVVCVTYMWRIQYAVDCWTRSCPTDTSELQFQRLALGLTFSNKDLKIVWIRLDSSTNHNRGNLDCVAGPDTWERYSWGRFSCAQFRSQRTIERGYGGLKPKVLGKTQTTLFLGYSEVLLRRQGCSPQKPMQPSNQHSKCYWQSGMARTPHSLRWFCSRIDMENHQTPVQVGQFGRHRMRSRNEVCMGGLTRIDHLKQLCYVNPTSTNLIL
jgi:hypothetical protein